MVVLIATLLKKRRMKAFGIALLGLVFLILCSTFFQDGSIGGLKYVLYGLVDKRVQGLDSLITFDLAAEAGREVIDLDSFANLEYLAYTMRDVSYGRDQRGTIDILLTLSPSSSRYVARACPVS